MELRGRVMNSSDERTSGKCFRAYRCASLSRSRHECMSAKLMIPSTFVGSSCFRKKSQHESRTSVNCRRLAAGRRFCTLSSLTSMEPMYINLMSKSIAISSTSLSVMSCCRDSDSSPVSICACVKKLCENASGVLLKVFFLPVNMLLK